MKVIKQSAHIVTDWLKMNLYERCEFAGRISHASEDKIKEGSAEEFVRRMVEKKHESVFEFARVGIDLSLELRQYMRYKNLRTIREQVKSYIKYPRSETLKDYLLGSTIAKNYPVFFEDIKSSAFWNERTLHAYGVEMNKKDRVWIPVLITTNRAISHQLVRYRKEVVYLQASQRYIKQQEGVDFIDPHIYFKDDNLAYALWREAIEKTERVYINFLSGGYSAQAARLVLPNSTATKLIMYASPDTWRHVFEQRISDKADPMIRELLEPLKEEFEKENLL